MSADVSIYDKLGVRRWINAGGYLTRLGGAPVAPHVRQAMAEAGSGFVDLLELQVAASRLIAPHTRTEAVIVTCGAASALTLATAAVLAGSNADMMNRLPDTAGMANEVLIHRSHRSSYDHAVRAAGARLVEFGFNDTALDAGFRGVEAWEVEAAITDQTVACFVAVTPKTLGALRTVASVAQTRGLPVIVDAAPWLPPKDNLHRFVDEGATLVAFSGGKALGAPAGTGILCGPKKLIASALLQQTDMTVVPELWEPPAELIDRAQLKGTPRHGIGRGMKVSKEEIAGFIVAFQDFLAADLSEKTAAQEKLLKTIEAGLRESGIAVGMRFLSAQETGRRPLLELLIDEQQALGYGAADVARLLRSLDTPVQLSERRFHDGILTVDPACLSDADVEPLQNALIQALASAEAHACRR